MIGPCLWRGDYDKGAAVQRQRLALRQLPRQAAAHSTDGPDAAVLGVGHCRLRTHRDLGGHRRQDPNRIEDMDAPFPPGMALCCVRTRAQMCNYNDRYLYLAQDRKHSYLALWDGVHISVAHARQRGALLEFPKRHAHLRTHWTFTCSALYTCVKR